jgi:hypothetical protein
MDTRGDQLTSPAILAKVPITYGQWTHVEISWPHQPYHHMMGLAYGHKWGSADAP